MVPGGTRAFLELPTGKVSGVALPGQAPPPVVVAAPAAAKPAAGKPAAKKPAAGATNTWVVVQPGRKPAPKPSPRP
jgi:hypothetical protein